MSEGSANKTFQLIVNDIKKLPVLDGYSMINLWQNPKAHQKLGSTNAWMLQRESFKLKYFRVKCTFRASSIPLGFLWKPAGMSASGVGARSNTFL